MVVFTFCFVAASVAQNGTVTGTVTDANSGETLPGVNIFLVENQIGASTDANGEYVISDIPSGTYTLRATFVGYKRYEVEITVGSGETVTRNIQLTSDVLGMEEVVVSALGFEEDRDKMGVSSANISGEEVAESGENSVLQGLSAKAAGVDITQSSGDPGAGARILIRGAKSLNTDNQPLFVIDGVPVYNSNVGSGVAGVTQQSRMNDLNPDDIASVEVLKGPSAAAIWGSRAANGVVVIETKTGSSDQNKVNISFDSEMKINELNKTVDLQNEFGQGIYGSWGGGSGLFSYVGTSWGDKISLRPGGKDVRSRSNYDYAPITEKRSKQTWDHSDEVFRNATSWDNSVSISGGNESSTFYLNASNLRELGIVKSNHDYDRTSFRANIDHSFAQELTASVHTNYVSSKSNRIQMGSNISGLLLGMYRTPPDFNNRPYLVDYVSPQGNVFEGRHRSYRNSTGNRPGGARYDNPYWIINENLNESEVNRFIGSTELQYNPTSWLSITERFGYDRYTDRRYELFPTQNATVPTGQLTEQNITEEQINNDLIVRASHTLNKDLSGSLLIGYNLNQRKFDNVGATSTNFVLEDAPKDVANAQDRFPFQNTSTIRTSALYSEFNVTAYNQLDIKISGRSESASTYGSQTDENYFYPSANVAWRFTNLEAFDNQNLLSFGKIRASYGKAGVQPGPYNTKTNYFAPSFGSGWGPAMDALYYGGGASRAAQEGNPILEPEITTEAELGLDLRFFDGRISLSGTYYQTNTDQAILGLDVAPSSGFSERLANGAKIENKGVELTLDAEWLQLKDLIITTSVNFNKNENEVTALSGVDNVFLNGFSSTSSRAVEGKPVGVLYGSAWERDENGNRVLDANGFPVEGDSKVIGDPNPDWTAGISNTIQWKGLKVSALLDIKQGGDVWNGTRGALSYFGRHGSQDWWTTISAQKAQSLLNFEGRTVAKMNQYYNNWTGASPQSGAYQQNSDGTYTFRGYIKDFGDGPVIVDETWFWQGRGSGFTGPGEQFIEDGSFIRLREVSVSYSLSSEGFRELTGLSSLDFGVKARNLKLWTDYSGIDPETNLTGPSNGRGLDYFNNPNTRSWIFSLRVNY